MAEVAGSIPAGTTIISDNVPPSSSGLGHRPFTAKAPVQIRLGVPHIFGSIAQLGERLNGIQEAVGSIPSGSTIVLKSCICRVFLCYNAIIGIRLERMKGMGLIYLL